MIYEVTLIQTNLDLHKRIRMTNGVYPFFVKILKKVQEDRLFQQQKEYKVDEIGLLWSNEILYVPEGGDIRSNILMKFHWKPYSRNPGYQNMTSTVNKHFLWPKLKADIALFFMKCQEY